VSNLGCLRSSVKLGSQPRSRALTCDSLWIYGRSTTRVRQDYVGTFSLSCKFLALMFYGQPELLQIDRGSTTELLRNYDRSSRFESQDRKPRHKYEERANVRLFGCAFE